MNLFSNLVEAHIRLHELWVHRKTLWYSVVNSVLVVAYTTEFRALSLVCDTRSREEFERELRNFRNSVPRWATYYLDPEFTFYDSTSHVRSSVLRFKKKKEEIQRSKK